MEAKLMNMTTSTSGVELIKRFEGLRLKAYLCPSGVWTIGYGHTLDVKKGDVITANEANLFLIEDLAFAEIAVNSINITYNYGFNQNQFDALVSFTFNCGKQNLLNLIKNGTRNIKEIGDALSLYNKSNGKTLQGLVNRRRIEQNLYERECVKQEVLPIKNVLYRVKPRYYIRLEPSINGKILSNSGQGILVEVRGKSGTWIYTDKGYISEEAFYDSFTV